MVESLKNIKVRLVFCSAGNRKAKIGIVFILILTKGTETVKNTE